MPREFRTGIVITGDGKGGVNALNLTQRELKKLGMQSRKTGDDAKRMTRRYGQANTGLAALKRTAGLAAVALGGVFSARALKGTIDYADQVQKAAIRLGATTEGLSELSFAAEQNGSSFESLTASLERGAKSIAEAASGTGEAKDALADLGLDARTLLNLAPEDQLAAIAEGLQGISNQSQRVQLVRDIFGRRGAELLPLLNEGAEGIAKFRAEAVTLGGSLSRSQADAAAEINDATNRVQTAFRGVGQTLVEELAPSLVASANFLANELPRAADVAGITFEKLRGFIAQAGANISETFSALTRSQAAVLDFLGFDETAAQQRLLAESYAEQASNLDSLGDAYMRSAEQQFDFTVGTQAGTDAAQSQAQALRELFEAQRRKRAAEQAASNAAEVQGQITALREENAAIEAGTDLAELRTRQRLAAKGATDEQIATIIALTAQQSELQRQADEAAAAEQRRADAAVDADQARAAANQKAIDEFLGSDIARDFAAGFDDASATLGEFVKRMGALVDVTGAYQAARAAVFAETEAGADREAKLAELAQRQARNQIALYGDMSAAAKQFFSEGSAGYEALESAEKAFRAAEIALALENLAIKLGLIESETLAQVGADAIKAASSGVAAAVSSMVGLPFPANLAALGATVAAIGALGVAIGGGGSGGGSAGLSAEQRQATQGRGTVLGDADAQSQSATAALEAIRDSSDAIAGINRQMLEALNVLNGQTQRVAAEIANVGLNSGFGFASDGAGFANTSRDNRIDSGVQVQAATLLDLMFGAVIDAYAVYNEGTIFTRQDPFRTQEVGGRVQGGIQDVFASIGDVVLQGVDTLGLSADLARERLGSTVFDELLISLEGLSGDELADALQSVFSAVGDQAAQAALPMLAEFQRLGEGTLETLARVTANTTTAIAGLERAGQAIDVPGERAGRSVDLGTFGTLELTLGRTAEDVARDTIAISNALIEASGGLGDFADNVQGFVDDFRTPAEQLDVVTADATRALGELGFSVPSTREAFADLVDGFRITDEASAQTYAGLLQLVPVLDDLFDRSDAIAEAARAFDVELGLADGLGPLRNALDDVGVSLAAVELAAQDGRAGLGELLGGLTDVQKSALEPFIADILALIPATVEASEGVQGVARDLSGLRRSLTDEIALAQVDGVDADLLRLDMRLRDLREQAGSDTEILGLIDQLAALERQSIRTGEAERLAAEARRQAEEQARVTQQAAAERQRIAQQAADEIVREQQALASERAGLERELLQLQGDTATLRRLELQALDPANQALQQHIFSLQDQQAAAQAAAQAEQALAAERERIASERAGLERDLLQLQGDTEALRALEIQALDPSNRALQERIFALRDQQATEERARQVAQDAARQAQQADEQEHRRLEDMRRAREQAAEEQLRAVRELLDVSQSLREFVSGLSNETATQALTLSQLQQQLFATAGLARNGDLEAAQQLPQIGRDVVDLARDSSTSRLEFARIVATVQGAVSAVATTLENQAANPDLMSRQLGVLEDIEANTRNQRIATVLNSPAPLQALPVRPLALPAPPSEATAGLNEADRQAIRRLYDLLESGLINLVRNTGQAADLLDDWDQIGLPPERDAA